MVIVQPYYQAYQQHAARKQVAEWQEFAAKKRRAALCKRRAGLPFTVGVSFALVDLQEARTARQQVCRLPG